MSIVSRMRKPLAVLFLAGVLGAVPAFAQEAEHKSAESSESASEKPGMEIWKWANFAILAGVLGYLISKNMGPMLVARSKQIQEGLAAGERAKADAEAHAAAITAKLSGLAQAVSEMKAAAWEERDRETSRIKRDTAAEFARIQQQALLEIESAGKLARLELQHHAAKLAIALAEQKVRARMSTDVQAALLQNFLGEIAASSSPASQTKKIPHES